MSTILVTPRGYAKYGQEAAYDRTLRGDRGRDETLRRGSGIERSQSGHGERKSLWHCGKQRFRQDRSHEMYLRVPAAQLRQNPGLWKKDRRGPGFSGVSRCDHRDTGLSHESDRHPESQDSGRFKPEDW